VNSGINCQQRSGFFKAVFQSRFSKPFFKAVFQSRFSKPLSAPAYYRRVTQFCDTRSSASCPASGEGGRCAAVHISRRSSMSEPRTKHQEKIIKNYYRNRDAIALQKAMEQVTELYLSEGKKRATIWQRLLGNLEKIGLPADQIKHLQEQDDPALVAETLKKFV
jgi:hypothetical protein